MSKTPRHHYQADGAILCGNESFVAYSEARYGCLHCVRKVSDLLHALRQTANQADFSGYDKRTRRAIELAFSFTDETADAPVQEAK